MTAQDVVSRLRKLLIDLGATPRFGDADLLEFFNDAPAMILGLKPSAHTTHATVTLAAGAEQALPASMLFLHDVTFNEASGTAIRRVERAQLDQFKPGWRQAAATTGVKHFMYDVMDPKVFWVYPPNAGDGAVEAEITELPAPIAGLTATLPLADEYLETYLYYLAYRAFDWDSDEPSNAGRSQSYYQRMAGTLGVKIRNASATAPQRQEP